MIGKPAGARREGVWPDQRVCVFVDTQNVFHSALALHGRTVNFEVLLREVVAGRRLVRATAYVVERDGDSGSRPFQGKLSALGYRVRRMTLRELTTDDQGRAIYSGNWDSGIIADMIRLSDQTDVLALVSGDGDFTEPLEALMERGLRAEVWAFREHTARALIDAVDTFTHLGEVEGVYMPLRRGAERVAN